MPDNGLMTWDDLFATIARMSGRSVVLVDRDGVAEYPREWVFARRFYRAGSDRYVLRGGVVWLVGAAGLVRMWAIRPARPVRQLAAGVDTVYRTMRWVATSDGRVTVVEAVTGARWFFKLVAGLAVLVDQDLRHHELSGPKMARLYGLANMQAKAVHA